MNRRHRTSSSQLEKDLTDLGTAIRVPPAPELAGAVRQRIEAGTLRRRRTPAAPLVVAAAVLLVAVMGGAALFSSTARDAVAGWLGIRGIDIVEDGPPPEHSDNGLSLGRKVTLEEARDVIPFDILLPRAQRLGPPDGIYIDETAYGGRTVSLVYRARTPLPPAPETGIGLLITQFEAGLRDDLMQKVRTGGVTVDAVRIGSSPAYWISGSPHYVFLLAPRGDVIEDRTRLAGDTLLWERGRVSLRLESGLGKARALRIARSMHAP